jgi:hypothetical protein
MTPDAIAVTMVPHQGNTRHETAAKRTGFGVQA